MKLAVEFTKVDERAIEPRNAYGNDAGWDLFVLEDTIIEPWRPGKVYTDVRSGVALGLPDGFYARLVGRSSAIRKKSLQVFEGIIDAGFRGELFTCVASALDENVILEAGSSICQIIVQEVKPVTFVEVGVLAPSARGENGFGSSGA